MTDGKEIKLLGLGNGIVDVLVDIQDIFLTEQGLKKSSMELVDQAQQKRLLEKLSSDYLKVACGGSVCNSIFTFASLGGSAAMITSLGQDDFGNFYLDELGKFQIRYSELTSTSSAPTGTSLVLISPDGERTMCTCLGASAELSSDHLDSSLLASADNLFIEGYLLAGDSAWLAVQKSIECAKSYQSKIIFTLSAEFIVQFFRPRVEEILANVDLLFANEQEAAAYTGHSDPRENAMILARTIPEVVITAGSEGAYYCNQDQELVHVPALPCKPVDLTGAGDAFAAGFLLARTKDLNPEQSLRLATYLAYRTISQVGARVTDFSLDELRNKAYL